MIEHEAAEVQARKAASETSHETDAGKSRCASANNVAVQLELPIAWRERDGAMEKSKRIRLRGEGEISTVHDAVDSWCGDRLKEEAKGVA